MGMCFMMSRPTIFHPIDKVRVGGKACHPESVRLAGRRIYEIVRDIFEQDGNCRGPSPRNDSETLDDTRCRYS